MSLLKSSIPRIGQQDNEVRESPVSLISSGDIILDLNKVLVHNFASVIFYNDPNGDTPIDPSALAGTSTVTIKTINRSDIFQDVNANVLGSNKHSQTDWAANTLQCKVEFAGITGVTHAKLIVTSNRH